MLWTLQLTLATAFAFLLSFENVANASTISNGHDLVSRQTTTANPTTNSGTAFVTTKNGLFTLGQSDQTFFFYGTNAYWLHTLSDGDIDLVFSTMAANGIKVVRTWAFNDVTQAPQGLPYFQVLSNGKQTINDGPSGLQRLDKVVQTAQKYGMRLIMTLTNNWTSKPNPNIPPLTLSDDFGGMDVYVQTFSPGGTHDAFYTNNKIISAFKNYIQHVVFRYSNNPTVMAWELANDPRCGGSTLPSSHCDTHTITTWVNEIAGFIKSIDKNHLVTAGDGGFYCLGCPKLYSHLRPTSPSPGSALDGAFGVDTEDILAVPCIDFGSFQLFPDQVDYGTFTPQASFLINSVATGSLWVSQHVTTGNNLKKPVALLAFAILLKEDFSLFVPFNASTSSTDFLHGSQGGVSDDEGNFAKIAWGTSGFNNNLGGLLNYQWFQSNLTGDSPLSRRGSKSTPTDGNKEGNHNTDQSMSASQSAQNGKNWFSTH